MNWTLAIDRNREALLRVVAMLFATAGLIPGGSVASLPRHVRCMILRLLRPAESAARRLIVVAAHIAAMEGRIAAPRSARPCPKAIPRGTGAAVPAFPLFDPRKRFTAGPLVQTAGAGPRLSIPGFDDPVFSTHQPASPGDHVDAARLGRRLHALQAVLDDLPGQARRFARWRAKRSTQTSGRLLPLRPGWPPGHRVRPIHAVDTVLSECHGLALSLREASVPILKPG